MPSKTEVCNIAIAELGGDLITDVEDGTRNARLCLARYDDCRDAVLRSHPWNCATFRFDLSPLADRPAFGFAYQYALPNDPLCLRVLRLEDTTVPFKVEGRRILTDLGPRLLGLYVGRIGEDQYDALLTQAIAAKLGSAIAYRLTTSQAQVERMQALYERTLREARSVDAQEGTPDAIEADELLGSRH